MVNPIKIENVNKLKEELKNSKSIVFTNFTGMTVLEITNLRRKLIKENVKYQVIKNTLAGIAMKDIGYSEAENILSGPIAIAYSEIDPVLPAKLVYDYSKIVKKLKIRGGIIEGKIANEQEVQQVATIPSREELISKLLYLMKWPVQGLVNVMNGPARSLLYALNAIKDKKEQ